MLNLATVFTFTVYIVPMSRPGRLVSGGNNENFWRGGILVAEGHLLRVFQIRFRDEQLFVWDRPKDGTLDGELEERCTSLSRNRESKTEHDFIVPQIRKRDIVIVLVTEGMRRFSAEYPGTKILS